VTSSLLAAGLELVGVAVNPEYRLTAGGLELSEGEPDDAVIASLLLDGDVVSGDRTKNRQPTLTVKVVGATRSDLSAKVDALLLVVTVKAWTLQWTPDGGLPIVFDCYRSSWTRTRDAYQDGVLQTILTLTFDALPFGRSPVAQTISGTASTQVDNFDTAPTGATLDTSTKWEGTGSAQFTLASDGGSHYVTAAPITRSFTAKDLSADQALTLRMLTSIGAITSTGTLTLSSAGGKSSTFVASAATNSISWPLLTFNLSAPTATTGGGVDLTAVTGYSLTVSATQGHANIFGSVTAHIDDLRAVGGTSALFTTTDGEVFLMPAILGSARAPVSLAVTGTSMTEILLHSPPGDQDSNAQILMATAVGVAPANTTVTVPPAAATYDGTYSLVLGGNGGGGGNDTVQITVTQLENGVAVASKTVSLTYTAPSLLTGKLIPVGDVTLPLRATADDNTLTSYTFQVNHTFGLDTYTDLMLCDVRGQTVIAVPPAAVPNVYVDAPTVDQGIGPIMASASGRSAAYGIFDGVLAVGGPILFEPGTNKIMAWTKTGAPTISATYFPRWLDERVV